MLGVFNIMSYIEIERIWTDDDEMLQLDFRASNDSQVGQQDFYIYPKSLLDFSLRLQEFPENIEDEVILEYGKDPNFYCYFLLRALVLDNVGHSALELVFNNRLAPPLQAEVKFYMQCEPATINELGKELVSWAANMGDVFRYEWKNT